MAKGIFIQDGEIIDYKNTGTAKIEYGDVVVLTTCIGVAECDIPAAATGSLSLHGVYELPAEATAAFTVGQQLYWDSTNSCLTATKATTGAITAGIAVAAKASAGTACNVRL